MKKFVILILCFFILSGCSLIPKINFGTPNTTPQSIDKSKAKDMCKGEAKFNEYGEIIYCSQGYYAYTENYEKKERSYTFKERIINFFNNLKGWTFWIVVALVIFAPGLAGTLVGRLLEATIGMTSKALRATVRGVQRARREGKDLNDSLSSEQDSDVKKYIAKIKDREKIK